MNTIFVVDDNSANLLVADELLSDDYDVITMLSVPKMFELLEKITPDLILLDIMMPDISGYDALEQLKADIRYKEIPVIFLTSKTDETAEKKGLEMGAADFVTKPFSAPVLLSRIESVLHSKST